MDTPECPEATSNENTRKQCFIKNNKEFIAGWMAASINILITFPLNKVIFRQMLHNVKTVDALHQLAGEGYGHLYRGVLPPLMQKSCSVATMFGVFEKCRWIFSEQKVNPTLTTILSALVAGTMESVFVPFERIQTLLQHEKYHKEFINMKHAIKVIGSQYGLKEYYRGLGPVLCRNGPSSACFFLMRERATKSLPVPESIVGIVLRQFAIGSCIGAFCSTTFYPINVIKVHMQSRIGGPFQSVPSAAREIYLERGSFRYFFRGVHLNFTRSCISWGVINVAYEFVMKLL